MERVDKPTDQVLRPSTKCTTHLDCVGYRGSQESYSCGRLHFQVVREEVVRDIIK